METGTGSGEKSRRSSRVKAGGGGGDSDKASGPDSRRTEAVVVWPDVAKRVAVRLVMEIGEARSL